MLFNELPVNTINLPQLRDSNLAVRNDYDIPPKNQLKST